MLLTSDIWLSLAGFVLTKLYALLFFEAHIKIRPLGTEGQRKVEFLNLYLIAYAIIFGKLSLVV